MSKRPSVRKSPKRHRWSKVVLAVLVTFVLVVVGLFSWNRWLRFDDASDIQGAWRIAKSETAVVIDGNSIQIADEVAYVYELDAGAKAMTFTFGGLSGSGRYWMSSDRQTLVLEDGNFSWFSTLIGDMNWAIEDMMATIQGRTPSYAVSENAMILEKVA